MTGFVIFIGCYLIGVFVLFLFILFYPFGVEGEPLFDEWVVESGGEITTFRITPNKHFKHNQRYSILKQVGNDPWETIKQHKSKYDFTLSSIASAQVYINQEIKRLSSEESPRGIIIKKQK